MKKMPVSKRVADLDIITLAAPDVDSPLNLTVVYQDQDTKVWAREVSDAVVRSAGEHKVCATWWKLEHLAQPGVLAGAVSTALKAQIIVVAVTAAEGLPYPFYVWVESWLQHRRPRSGALIALLSLPRRSEARAHQARQYLRDLAQQGGLEFLLEERPLVTEPAVKSEEGYFVRHDLTLPFRVVEPC
ncbi:hypothetical protein SBV1_30027 [Verrucomicrobia bacterium]|nr:hypothetical protein SBV1_30027 [Verrucomicrobiota bacterium]